MDLRIGGGTFRGRALHHGKGLAVRPTSGAVRAALAAIVRPRLVGARVLDLFAGYGSTGLELLSHGAGWLTLVEKDRAALDVLRRNVALLEVEDSVEIWPMPVATALARRECAEYDIIFVDPPYERGLAGTTVERLAERPEVLRPGGLLVVQHSRREVLPAAAGPLQRIRERRSGDTVLSFYEEGETA